MLRIRISYYIIPKLVALFLIIMSVIPLPIQGITNFMPMFAFMVIFYYATIAPGSMPLWFVFVLGIFEDVLFAIPTGISALLNIIFRYIVVKYRLKIIGELFVRQWLIFAFAVGIVSVLKWLLFSFYFSAFLPFTNILMQMLLTISIYPIFHGLFDLLTDENCLDARINDN